MSIHNDIRRWIAFRVHGTSRFLLSVQAAVEDVEGAIEAEQYDVAFYQARTTILKCLSIQSLLVGGDLVDSGEFEPLNFDPFFGLEREEIKAGLRLLSEWPLAVQEGLIDDWHQRFCTYVMQTEALLGFDSPLPTLRSPGGLQAILALWREWDTMMTSMELPSSVPLVWVKTDKKTIT